jgi:hypothetical protein
MNLLKRFINRLYGDLPMDDQDIYIGETELWQLFPFNSAEEAVNHLIKYHSK